MPARKAAAPAAGRRKGASRRADIPPDVLSALNEGREESVTLVEWLAIDAPVLLRHVARDIGLASEAARLSRLAEPFRALGIAQRNRAVAALLAETIGAAPHESAQFERLASHPSDTARAWAAQILACIADMPLSERLRLARRFASDPNMGVREIAWDTWRPFAVRELPLAFSLLEGWVADEDPSIRRCAVEGTRPRGVWTAHIAALKDDPSPGLRLLEPVRSDSSDYVRKAVANWLNDASKSRPEWATATCARWSRESRTKETAWIVQRAMRTLRKPEAR